MATGGGSQKGRNSGRQPVFMAAERELPANFRSYELQMMPGEAHSESGNNLRVMYYKEKSSLHNFLLRNLVAYYRNVDIFIVLERCSTI